MKTLILFVAFALLIPTALARHQSSGMTKSFCASAADRPVVYITAIFDIKTAPGHLSAQPLNNAFYYYLIEEYDYKNTANYPAQCRLFQTLSQAEATRRQILADAQQAGGRIIDVPWKPSPALAVAQDNGDETPSSAKVCRCLLTRYAPWATKARCTSVQFSIPRVPA